MMKKKLVIVIFLILISALHTFGCSSNTMEEANKMPPNNIIWISPSKDNLTTGPISGSVEVRYSGPKKTITMNYEVWEEGKVKKLESYLSSSIGDKYKGDVSASLMKKMGDQKNLYQVTMQIGNGSFTTTEEFIIPEGLHIPLPLDKDIEISDDQEIAVWGYAVYKNGSTPTNPSVEGIEESAKVANWALVLRIHMDD